MTPTLTRLMLTTALCVPMATAASAQATTESCQQLEALIESGDTEMFDDPERIQAVIDADDAAACDVELVAVEAVESESETETDNGTAVESETEEATLEDTESLTVDLEDQITVQGLVYLDRQPAEVDLQEGETEVTVSNDQPEVTVNEGQAEIVVRQQPANVTVMMTQPTIRIEQPAPEIIITMPEPGVDVASSQPTVEVRQAEPTVSVMQAAPIVALELQEVEEGADTTTQVTDRATGETIAAGETGEAAELSDTTVNVTSSEPNVVIQDGEAREPVINRSEPTVTFEAAEPQVMVEQSGEATVEMVQTGEPTVTINAASDSEAEGDDTAQPAMDESDEAMMDDEAMMEDGAMAEGDEAMADTETDAETALENAGDEVEQEAEETAAEVDAATDEAAAEVDAATDEAAAEVDQEMNEAETAMATDGAGLNGPAIEMEGYSPAPMNMLSAEMLENAPIYGTSGDEIGEVGSVLIGDDARVSSLVLRVGGFLGLGEHAVEVPMDQLTILADENDSIRVFVDETEDRLQNMPEYQE
ncbi:PRC-barrel domain-containing protein [Salipiger sp. IMCC34102]|uniref:PRC-barrel domain-containing protein n=1 Tax=Salipiger sp. IMCC34102 TaxID=2510647 RepID=UPI0013ED2AAB|nr:PRC-barrel domain-containing protein [Salipiger sp. IMCC34102]